MHICNMPNYFVANLVNFYDKTKSEHFVFLSKNKNGNSKVEIIDNFFLEYLEGYLMILGSVRVG